MKKFSKVIHITFAVIKDTALGSGNVLGIQLHNCHINLEFENYRLKFSRSKIFLKCVTKDLLLNLPNLPKICMFKNVFVLKKLHVIMPNPLKKKMLTWGIRKHVSWHFTNIFIRQNKTCSRTKTKQIHALKIYVDFF